jgi:transcriptional regulator with XRE-family HTH domain
LNEDKIHDIANRIATARKSCKISLQDMADFVGLGYEQYRRIESGKVLIKTEYLFSIAKKLKVSTDFLLYGDSSNVISDSELASLLNGLSSMELERAKNVLKAVFI